MMSSSFFTPHAPAIQVNATLAIVPNQLFSLWALTAADVAVEPWTAQTAAQLTPA